MKTMSPNHHMQKENNLKKVLVTGGNGFLGSYILRDLLRTGHYEVYSFSRTNSGKSDTKVTHRGGDLKNLSDVMSALSGMDAVIHTASKVGMGGTYDDYYQTNVIGTKNIIDACLHHKIKSLVYTSTPSVAFGNSDLCGIDESHPLPKKYLGHYAHTKAIAEKMILAAHRKELKTLSIRPHLIFGPGDLNLIPRVLKKAQSGQLKIVGNGKNLVDVTYVENASHAHLLALNHLETMPLEMVTPGMGQAYFLGQGPVPLWDFINQILKLYNAPIINKNIPFTLAFTIGFFLEKIWEFIYPHIPKHVIEKRGLDENPPMSRFMALQLGKSHYFNCQKIEHDLNYHHLYSIEEGLQKLVSTQ